MYKKTEKLKKPLKKLPRGKNGGARPGSGRKALVEKPIIQELKVLIDNHGKDLVEVTTASGVIKKARVLILLDKLFVEGYKGNIQAIKEYLDRTLGKAPQPLTGDTKNPLAIRIISVDPAIAQKYDLDTSTKDNSGGSP